MDLFANDNEPGKACTKCGEWKARTKFYKDGDSLRGECKECTKEIRSKHYRNNREAAIEYARARRRTPEGKRTIRVCYERQAKDPEKRKKKRAYMKAYYAVEENKRAIIDGNNRRTMERRKSDPLYAANLAARAILRRCLESIGGIKSSATFEMLGYTADNLRQRLECQFQSGMSWKNRGDWHIDHKKPVAAFVKQGITDPKTINALCNLRPLWATENLSKAASWVPIAANDNIKQDCASAA
ncbi:MAG: hypothetical protein WBB98_04735 [Xanthobacteraceae bacterium]